MSPLIGIKNVFVRLEKIEPICGREDPVARVAFIAILSNPLNLVTRRNAHCDSILFNLKRMICCLFRTFSPSTGCSVVRSQRSGRIILKDLPVLTVLGVPGPKEPCRGPYTCIQARRSAECDVECQAREGLLQRHVSSIYINRCTSIFETCGKFSIAAKYAFS